MEVKDTRTESAGAELTDTRLDGMSLDIAAEKRLELLELFPEVRTVGDQIDFDRLRLALGESVDVGRERYGLTWPGKSECFKTIQAPSMATLLPAPEKSVNFDTTENLIIEGDNLEVLKLLQKSYLGKIKMIYIDPPYNTGNDFIYPDDYSESLQTYLQYTGQVDSEGKKFGTNTDTDGRFHSRWLNMMYPRLYLARNLLAQNGIMFVSINDVEAPNLRRLCDEIFGEELFIAQFVWKSRVSEDTRAISGVSNDHEYVICYGSTHESSLRGSEKDVEKFSDPDNDARGPWRSADLTGLATKDSRPNLHYDLIDPATGINYGCPSKGWRYEPTTMQTKIAEGRILWPTTSAGRPRHKLFLKELATPYKNQTSVILDTNTAEGTKELRAFFDSEGMMQFPKPTSLINTFTEQSTGPGDIVLDFFAGSGTTAQAVLDLNARDAGSRRFILVQLPEPTQRADYPTIADIAEERVRLVINKLDEGDQGKLNLPISELQDRGFRVFKLAESNVKEWDTSVAHDVEPLKEQLALGVDHLRHDRSDLDLVYEILLKSGYPLSARVSTDAIAGKTVYSVAEGAFLICLERKLTLELIRAIAARKPERVLLLDDGFSGNDQLKTNAVQTFKDKNVVFRTL